MRGRARTIKPELFSDETLGDLEQSTKLPVFRAFVGLLCFADREGRFEWAPRALRGAILPCWDGDMASVLEALASKSYVVRYTVNGKDYGFVRAFKKHQIIHPREAASVLPAPEAHGVAAPSLEKASLGQAQSQPRLDHLEADSDSEVDSDSGSAQEREPMPHERAAARQAQATTPGARPVVLFEFRPEWKPKKSHQQLGYSLGLNDDDIGARVHDCRNKVFEKGFTSEDKQFNRELAWAARDKETAAFKLTQRKASNVRDFEQPGHRRSGS